MCLFLWGGRSPETFTVQKERASCSPPTPHRAVPGAHRCRWAGGQTPAQTPPTESTPPSLLAHSCPGTTGGHGQGHHGATRQGHRGGGPWRPRPLHDQLDVCGAASPAQDRDRPSTSPACPGLRAPRPPEGMGTTPPRQHTQRSGAPQTVLTPVRCSLSPRAPLPLGQPCPQAPTQRGGRTVLAVRPA